MSKIAFIFPSHKLARQAFERFIIVDSARKFDVNQRVIFREGLEIHFISLDKEKPPDQDKLTGMRFSAIFTDDRVDPIFRAFLLARTREVI